MTLVAFPMWFHVDMYTCSKTQKQMSKKSGSVSTVVTMTQKMKPTDNNMRVNNFLIQHKGFFLDAMKEENAVRCVKPVIATK